VTDYGVDGWCPVLGGGKIFLSFIASRTALGLAQPPIQWITGALSPGVKLPGREDDHSAPTSATPPHVFMTWCFINEDWGNFTFTLL
jgi:hypothetical protein